MTTDMIVLITVTIVLALGSGVCGLLLTILLGLGGWMLASMIKFGNRMAAVEQLLKDLPCGACPRTVGHLKRQ
jgi:hypothetical protein